MKKYIFIKIFCSLLMTGCVNTSRSAELSSQVSNLTPLNLLRTEKTSSIRVSSNSSASRVKVSDAMMDRVRKCVKAPPNESVRSVSLVEVREYPSPKVGKRTSYHAAVEITDGGKSKYILQIMLFNGSYCHLFYLGSGVQLNPLSSIYPKAEAHSIALAWHKWRLKNIPGERREVQKSLNSDSPALAEEDYWSYSQLGFKMPAHYQILE